MKTTPPSFDRDGYGYLLKFIRKQKGKPFSAEDVTLSAMNDGIAPPDLRNWGKMFVQARNDGYIRRSSYVCARSMGHGSLTLGWVAN
jgi:hypothetical protein